MKKIIISIIIVLIITIIFFGLINITISKADYGNSRFVEIEDARQYFDVDGYWFYIIYDKDTKVEYAFSGKGGLQVLVDAEGQPLLYKESEEK